MDVETYLQTLQLGGVGYDTGYTTLAFQLFPNVQPAAQSLYFIDARFHYFNDNKWAANLGFAVRSYKECWDAVLGINAFYDFRQIHDEFHQVGVGLEMLGRRFDLRVNGYLPIAQTTFFGHTHNYNYPGGYFASCTGINRALVGGDAEICTSFWRCGCRSWCGSQIDPYIGIGPYYYTQRNQKNPFWGAKARIGVNVGRRCTVEVRGSHDKFFGTLIQGFISFNFTLGPKQIPYSPGCCYDPCVDAQLHSPIQRQEIIAESKPCCCWSSNF
jgi:hypothetical protein